MHKIARASLPILAALALLSAGCGSSSSGDSGAIAPTSTGRADASGTARAVMKDLEFTPGAVEASVGQTLVWTNQDSSPHNVTYVSGPQFRSSGTMEPGAKFSIRLTEPGTIRYYCTIHPWMKATIIVAR